ncbi:hypothetical protein MLD38_006108 [Melastoma candidum]|uniref:Uncharacterized protein n=1 Tax=Melastoma candidum TaxID=119954 RepID=A0ACB9RME8_9MYRT|nr:hypothetical protein MLD38_006108 [Melastoma candidum]
MEPGRSRSRRAECLSPSRIISRLFRRLTARKLAGESNANAGPEDRDQVPPHAVVAGDGNKESAVNLGVACSLFYLAAASKNELEKMKELRIEMRAFLQEIKAELNRKHHAREPGGEVVVVESPRSCLTDAVTTVNCSSRRTPFVVAEEESIVRDRPSGSGETRQDCIREMEWLEAELEAELARLQLHLDPDIPSEQGPEYHAAEVGFGEIQAEDLDRATSGRTSMGEGMNPLDVGDPESQGGVPAIELERKLHELLQSRQEERIKELETALECYKHELHDTDRELSWWRDTAMMLSQYAKESPSKGSM